MKRIKFYRKITYRLDKPPKMGRPQKTNQNPLSLFFFHFFFLFIFFFHFFFFFRFSAFAEFGHGVRMASSFAPSTPPSTPGGGFVSRGKQVMTPASTHRSARAQATATTSRAHGDANPGGADAPPPRHDDRWLFTHLHQRRRSGAQLRGVRIAETVFVARGEMDVWYFTHARDGRLARKNSYNTVPAMLCDRLVLRARERVLSSANDHVCVVRWATEPPPLDGTAQSIATSAAATAAAGGDSGGAMAVGGDVPELRTEVLRVPAFLELLAREPLPRDLVSMQEYVASDRGELPTLYVHTLTRDESGPARKEVTSTRKVVHMSASQGEDVEVEMRSVAREMNARFDTATRAVVEHLEAVARLRVHSVQLKYLIPAGTNTEDVVLVGVFDLVATPAVETVPFHVQQAERRRQLVDARGRRLAPDRDARAGPVLLPLAKAGPESPLAALLSRQRRSVLFHRQCHGDFCDLDLARCTLRDDGSLRAVRRVAKLPPFSGVSGISRRSIILARQDSAMQRVIRIKLRERSRLAAGGSEATKQYVW
jgi:hypothetical protein